MVLGLESTKEAEGNVAEEVEEEMSQQTQSWNLQILKKRRRIKSKKTWLTKIWIG